MPRVIPEGLTRGHVLRALAELDSGVEHPFGQPTGYWLVYQGRHYPPKAAVGLAFRYQSGQPLGPHDFSGGGGPGQANFILRQLGFEVIEKEPRSAENQWVDRIRHPQVEQ